MANERNAEGVENSGSYVPNLPTKGWIRIVLRIFSVAILLLWMYVISGFSGQNAEESSSLSLEVSCFAVEQYDSLTNAGMTDEEIRDAAEEIETPVRKLAHMTEYGILALLGVFVLWTFGRKGRWAYLAIPFCFLYAVTDEYHQTFVEGRAGQVRDVMIDTSGAILAFLCLRLIFAMVSKIKFKYNKNEKR